VWNYKFIPQTNLVDVHIGRLRRKVDIPPYKRDELLVVPPIRQKTQKGGAGTYEGFPRVMLIP
jgi:hypothetical protein